MANIDKKQQAKDGLINTIKRTVEKTVSQGNFTKTILATIQYCADKVNGQYKIRYQNGYFTAYAQNPADYVYSEGALVYVLVPKGDFTARLLIIGSASNLNDDKIYLDNLSDEQKFKIVGSNLLIPRIVSGQEFNLNLSSYMCDQGNKGEYVKDYYNCKALDKNMYTLNENVIDNIKKFTFFRLGARFKTKFTDNRKLQGDYGIKIVAVFQKDKKKGTTEEKEYILNTFIMDGAPFEFNDPVPQYCFWELTNPKKFLYIKSVSGFVKNFPESTREDYPEDILITDLSIYAAEKLYDTTNDTYRVQIDSPESDFTFKVFNDESRDYVDLVGRFYIKGIGEVQGETLNDLKFYWAKKDCLIDSAANPRYSKAFGAGWYRPCLLLYRRNAHYQKCANRQSARAEIPCGPRRRRTR